MLRLSPGNRTWQLAGEQLSPTGSSAWFPGDRGRKGAFLLYRCSPRVRQRTCISHKHYVDICRIELGDWEAGGVADRNGGSQTQGLVCPEGDELH